MTGTDFIGAQLALKAWQDGYSEGLNGMLGIAFTIRNRVRAGWYGGSWIDVLSHHQEWQASLEPPTLTLPDVRIYSVNALLQEITGIVNGTKDDDITRKRDTYAGGFLPPGATSLQRPGLALYYGHLNKVDNPWFLKEIAQNPAHQRIANMATLTFWS